MCFQPPAIGVPPDSQWMASSCRLGPHTFVAPGCVTVHLVTSRGQTALHRPAPAGARASHGPPGLMTLIPSGLGRLGYRRRPIRLRLTRIRSRCHPARLRPTRITGRTPCPGPGQLGSKRPVASHDADHSGSAGLGPCPSSIRLDRCQWYNVPRSGPAQQVRSTWVLLRQVPLEPLQKAYAQGRMGSPRA